MGVGRLRQLPSPLARFPRFLSDFFTNSGKSDKHFHILTKIQLKSRAYGRETKFSLNIGQKSRIVLDFFGIILDFFRNCRKMSSVPIVADQEIKNISIPCLHSRQFCPRRAESQIMKNVKMMYKIFFCSFFPCFWPNLKEIERK